VLFAEVLARLAPMSWDGAASTSCKSARWSRAWRARPRGAR
jgi:hypothetical protein